MAKFRNIFNVPLSCSFWDTLAELYVNKYKGDNLGLASCLFLVPNRRACQMLIAAFVRQQGEKPAVLPQIAPISEIDDDDLFFSSFGLENNSDVYQKTPISQEERLFLFTRLILSKPNDFGIKQISTAQALSLAQDLAGLIDNVYNLELSFDNLFHLVPEKYATHWQETLKLLQIITQYWPKILEERNAVDVCVYKRELMYKQAEIWQREHPLKNIVIAGVTACFPAIVCLMKTVLELENGEVYFYAVDKNADDKYWEAVDESHPQFELKELLEKLDICRKDVKDVILAQSPLKERFISEVMRPAPVSDAWRFIDKRIDNVSDILSSMQLIESPNQREEALAIALKLREVLNYPEKTAALVTYDRNLARRVALELKRFDITVDDSAGVPLGLSPIGIYFKLIAEAAENMGSDVKFISLLKHPFTLCHSDAASFRKNVYDYEYALRQNSLTDSKYEEFIAPIKVKLLKLSQLISLEKISFLEILRTHMTLAEELASSSEQSGDYYLWRGEAGKVAAKLLSKIIEHAETLGNISGRDYLSVFSELMNRETVRAVYGTHPRLSILGPIEAKLGYFDYVILGEFNEGIWPKASQADMWMSRPMKKDFGLSLPEKNIGILGADLCGFLASNHVILTRAERIDGVPMKKSRWLLRLETVFKALNVDIENLRKNDVTLCAETIDYPKSYCPIKTPAPCPPLYARPRKLSASAVDLLVADPYSFFAKYILKLYALDDLDTPLNQRDYGTLVHGIIEDFNNLYSQNVPDNAFDIICRLGQKHFDEAQIEDDVKAFWWPKFIRTAQVFLSQDSRMNVLKINNEVSGEIEYSLADGKVIFTAKADRIDALKDGSLNIIDYKTGNIPTRNQVRGGHALQLLLEGLIALKGKFSGISSHSVEKLIYWHLGTNFDDDNLLIFDVNEEDILSTCEGYLIKLMETFCFETTPYLSRPVPKYIPKNKDYEHLARIREWSVLEEDADE